MKLYIPTLYGDINMTRSSRPKSTLLDAKNLSVDEIVIVKAILKKFKVPEPKTFGAGKIEIPADLSKVHAAFNRIMKAKQPVITAVKLAKGRIEEVRSIEEAEKKSEDDGLPEESRKAVTTKVPLRGCPMPIFDAIKAARIRATRVLHEFLGPNQRADFDRLGSFVTIGGETGNKYIVSHRDSEMASRRGLLFDVKGSRSLCVHHTDLPPAEELLALHVVLSCPTLEKPFLAYALN